MLTFNGGLRIFLRGGAKSINFWYKGARGACAIFFCPPLSIFCPPLSICSGGAKFIQGGAKRSKYFFQIIREQKTLFHTSLTLLQSKISEIWHKNALCMRETIIKKYFFPWAGAKRLRGGGETSQEGAKSQGGAKRLRGGQSLRGGQGNYPRGGQCPPLRGSGGGIAPFAPPLSRHCFKSKQKCHMHVKARQSELYIRACYILSDLR